MLLQGELVIECNSDELKQATVRPTYRAQPVYASPPSPGTAAPLIAGSMLRWLTSRTLKLCITCMCIYRCAS